MFHSFQLHDLPVNASSLQISDPQTEWWSLFMERNRILGNTEQLCKSLLQCLNSTSCTVKITRRAKCPKGVLEHPIVCISLELIDPYMLVLVSLELEG